MRRFETLITLIAFLFYGWFLWHFGTASVLRDLRLAWWGLSVTVCLDAFLLTANTAGWRAAIVPYPKPLSFKQLFAARIAGEAIDYLTPTVQLGGSFVSAMMIRDKLSLSRGLASTAIASLSEALSKLLFIVAALILSARQLPPSSGLKWLITGGLVVTAALTSAFYVVQVKRPFSHLWSAARRLNIGQSNADITEEAVREADETLTHFYRHQRAQWARSCFCYFAAACLGPVEIYFLFSLLHQHVTFSTALLIEALAQLADRVTFMIPGKLVTREGGKALIVSLLGYPAQLGFVVGLLRHAKEMLWVLAGLLCLAHHRASLRSATEPVGAGAEHKVVVGRPISRSSLDERTHARSHGG
jgi:uncharacterized membrane protein YbhN (UPF0104 family)